MFKLYEGLRNPMKTYQNTLFNLLQLRTTYEKHTKTPRRQLQQRFAFRALRGFTTTWLHEGDGFGV